MNTHSVLRVAIVILLLTASYSFGKFQGGFVSWFLFYSFLPIATLSIAHYFFSFRGVRVERFMDKRRLTAGQTLSVTITIYNPSHFPFVYLTVEDRLPAELRMSATTNKQVLYPWFKKKIEINYELESCPRGVHSLEHIVLETGDLFGLMKQKKAFPQVEEIKVYPAYEEIISWKSFNDKNMGSTYTERSHYSDDISSVIGTREYAPGDRLSQIHWKASARNLALKTKEFEHQVSNDFMFVLDCEEDTYAQSKGTLFERAVSLTASLAYSGLRQHFSCGLASNAKRRPTIPMSRQNEQLYRIFDHLTYIDADADESLIRTLFKEVADLPIGTTVVIISAGLHKRLVAVMSELRYRQIKVEFFWVKGDSAIADQHKHWLPLLEKEGIAHYVIADSNFNQALSGGAERHVSS